MRVIVDSYVYGLIKIASLERLAIKPDDYKKLEEMHDDKKLLDALDDFFPGISHVKNPNIINIEKQLLSIYFRIFEKILVASPEPMQEFMKSLLIRYEIWNIKTYILGMLAGLNFKEIRGEILMRPEKIMLRNDFIRKLLNLDDLGEAIRYLKDYTRYSDAIDRGWYYFQEKGEVFVLEALLDKYYMDNLVGNIERYSGTEKKVFRDYIDILVAKYNLMLVFRGVSNKIPKDLLKQFIIPQQFLDRNSLENLIDSRNKREFLTRLMGILGEKSEFLVSNVSERARLELNKEPLSIQNIKKEMTEEDPISPIFNQLHDNIFRKYETRISEDLDEKAIKNTLDLILRKEEEIYKVLALFVRIYHQLK